MAQREILLDTGTNEVEILEFFLGKQSFGINVAKVMQIVAFEEEKFTEVPDRTDAYLGVLTWHGSTIPLINLNAALRRREEPPPEKPVVLVTKFNEVTNGFMISGVNYIHRVSWEQIDPASSLIENNSSTITGSVHIDNRDILLVDFEYLVADMFPETKMAHRLADYQAGASLQRRDVKLVFAEDSGFIRKNVTALMGEVGFGDVKAFENGQLAYEYMKKVKAKAQEEKRPVTDFVNMVITDIEMPQMDGLTLCRHLKKEMKMLEVPVAVFSSLIDEQMGHKCREVGADVFSAKPKINELVGLIDRMLKINQEGVQAA